MDQLVLTVNEKHLTFSHVPLQFKNGIETDVFAKKNNKTLRETISHPKYIFLKELCENNLSGYLDVPLGQVLLILKQNNKPIYKEFLNPYGDLAYSQFSIQDPEVLNQKGLYTFTLDEEIVYIGRCLDSFKKRINYGYGKIAPKNCYRDGQSTNCHLNSLITQEKQTKMIGFYVLSLNNIEQIKRLEADLINLYNPRWNTQLKLRG